MRGGRYAAALLSAAVLVLAVWVTNTEAVHLLPRGSAPLPTSTGSTTTGSQQHHVPISRQPHHQPASANGIPQFFTVLSEVLLSVVAAFLLLFLSFAVLGRKRRAKMARLRVAEVSPDAVDALGLSPVIRAAAERQLLEIRRGAPRNAIVACWIELERACSDTGLPPAGAETSTEFTERVLARYAVRAQAVGALAALYREARFSEHHLTEYHRERAVSALESILASLQNGREHQPTPAGLG